MFTVRRTDIFIGWLNGLKDRRAAARILRLEDGNLGDARSVGEGVREMRIDYGPGYRVYFVQSGSAAIVLLCGGDKSKQARDIAKAKKLARDLQE
jgi:putative addiction module killer protein